MNLRFSCNDLSPAMNVALTYLIEHGGIYSHYDLIRDATDRLGSRYNVKVVDQTIWALIRRGLLDRGPDASAGTRPRTARMQVQLSQQGVSAIVGHWQNPHPVPVMQAWALQEHEREPRLSKGPDDTVQLRVGALLDLLHEAAQYGYWSQAAESVLEGHPATVHAGHHKALADAVLAKLGIGWAGL